MKRSDESFFSILFSTTILFFDDFTVNILLHLGIKLKIITSTFFWFLIPTPTRKTCSRLINFWKKRYPVDFIVFAHKLQSTSQDLIFFLELIPRYFFYFKKHGQMKSFLSPMNVITNLFENSSIHYSMANCYKHFVSYGNDTGLKFNYVDAAMRTFRSKETILKIRLRTAVILRF